ncbi:MAG: aquaporin [Actinomycetota bacterium]
MLEPRQHGGDGPVDPLLPLDRAAAAELLGSFTLVLFGAGSVIVAGSIGGGLVGVALATGFAFAAAQVVGAVLAGVVLRLGVPQPTWQPAALGAPLLAEGVGAGRGVLVEAVATFILTMVAFAMFVDDRVRSAASGALALGLLVAAATLFAWPLTGAALNPARAIGPEIAGATWTDWWVYWIGPGAGAVIGAVAYWSVFLREPTSPRTD